MAYVWVPSSLLSSVDCCSSESDCSVVAGTVSSGGEVTSADGPVVGDHVAPTSVGWDVVGECVGFAVGGAVGTDVAGLEVGCNDGDPVGREVAGAAVGAADGDGDGAVVGGAVGADDAGDPLGAVVVGVELGVEDVGAEVLPEGVG